MKNYILLVLVICVTFGYSFGQDQVLTEEELKEQLRQQRIIRIKNQAELQPVELAADILWRMLDANLIKENVQKTEIIESLFSRADGAKRPIKRKNFFMHVDTRGGYQSMTYGLELDQLSIQLKAVEQMLKVDKNRAREMFTAIPQLRLPPLKCEDTMLPELSRFYTTLGSIIEQTFDAEAKEQKQDMFFAGSFIDRIQSPLELKPAADMLVKLNVSKEYFDYLLNRYITAMGRMSADPRSLAIALRFHSLSNVIQTTLYSKEGNSPAASKELINTYRKMVVSSLSERQCADYLFITEVKSDDPTVPPKKTIHQSVLSINDILEQPITIEEIEPGDVGPKSAEYEFWKLPKSLNLLREGQKLNFASDLRTPLTSEQKRDPEWQRKVMVYRQMMADWKPEDEETESDYFDQKNVLYMHLMTITRDNEALMSEIMMEYGIFVRDSPMFKEFPAEWLKYAKLLKPAPTWTEERKKRFVETLTSSSSEGFPLMFELQALIDEKR